MSNMSWEWVAGFFEGEGNVYCQEGKNGTKQGLHGRAIIGQKKKEALDAIYEFLIDQGLSKPSFLFRKAGFSPSAKGKPTDIWILMISRRDDVIRFYTEISPFLYDKKKKAEYVMGRLLEERNQRDRILSQAIELKNSGMTWREVSRTLKVGRVAITNYARSAGIDLKKYKDNEIDFRQDRINRGLCETCGNTRGDDGTKRKCRKCADKYNIWRNNHRRIYGRWKPR